MKHLWRASVDFTRRWGTRSPDREGVLHIIQGRLLFASGVFIVAFSFVALRLADVMILRGVVEGPPALTTQGNGYRADIHDCNGAVLATYLVTGSVYANPRQILNVEEAANKLSTVLPDVDKAKLIKRLGSSKRQFVWIARHISPKMQDTIHRLGIPGIYLMRDKRRVYPYGHLVSHVLGYVGVDGDGLAGIEKFFDANLKENKEPIRLSLDVRVQHVVHDELSRALEKFSAREGNAMVLDTRTGEIIAMVSLPDYDPNLPNQNDVKATFNRNTQGLLEHGSVCKGFAMATALETGSAKLTSLYDARAPLRVGRFAITDFRGKNRILTLKEAFLHSSNIATGKIALEFGGAIQRKFLRRFGLFSAATLELPEIATPLVPKYWPSARIITASYGYGFAPSPLQVLLAVGGIIKAHRIKATLLKQDEPVAIGEQLISYKTSEMMKDLMRLVVVEGTAKTANIEGYGVIGKTGSAHITKGRSYEKSAKRTTFIGAFPYKKSDGSCPRYMLFVMLEDPKAMKETHGFSTAGWNAAPTGGKIIERIAPLLRVTPVDQEETNGFTQEIVAIQNANNDVEDTD